MKYTDEQLLKRVSELPTFRGFSGVLDIWVRSKKDQFDVFDDKVYTYDCRGDKPKFIMVCTGTTNAGAVGLKHYAKYNANGCAVLKADHIQYDSHVYGRHKNEYPAYVENALSTFPYFRDSDKDNFAEELGIERHDNIGANCHHAGIYSTRIGGWSVACLVRNKLSEWDAWLKFCHVTAKVDSINIAILKEF